ncbi:MAG: YjfB family protein [Oscillospiraceae bacterium]
MDIAAYSIQNNINQVMQSISISMMDKTMEQAEIMMDSLVETMEVSNPPIASGNIGFMLDVRA